MKTRTKKIKRAFTLIEAIVSSVILCGTVMAVSAISVRNMSTAGLNRHYESALGCIDRQLTLIDYMGIDAFIEAGETSGEITDIEPGYYWQVVAEQDQFGNLYHVTITVNWIDGNRPYSISIDTRLAGREEQEQPQPQSGQGR